jgi:hypothetical protein
MNLLVAKSRNTNLVRYPRLSHSFSFFFVLVHVKRSANFAAHICAKEESCDRANTVLSGQTPTFLQVCLQGIVTLLINKEEKLLV